MEKWKEYSDKELVRRTKDDAEFFGVLMDRYEAPLLRYIGRLGKFSAEDCEDILQEVFIKAYRNICGYDGSAKFSSWLYRISHNQAIDRLRRTQATISLDEGDIVHILASDADCARDAIDAHTISVVRDSIAALPEKYRDALILWFLEEKSYEEIMDILEKPKGSVATLIRRGKKMLADELKRRGITT